MGIIRLNNMNFYGYHGVYDFEKEQGANFEIDLELFTSLTKSSKSDNIEDTINYEDVYGTDLGLTKAERLEYHQTLMTHAMLFTGVDVHDGHPRKWRVENSWGDEEVGEKGFQTMNDSWFDEYMFEVVIEKKYLTDAQLEALAEEPIVLPPWDPMGSLARASSPSRLNRERV